MEAVIKLVAAELDGEVFDSYEATQYMLDAMDETAKKHDVAKAYVTDYITRNIGIGSTKKLYDGVFAFYKSRGEDTKILSLVKRNLRSKRSSNLDDLACIGYAEKEALVVLDKLK